MTLGAEAGALPAKRGDTLAGTDGFFAELRRRNVLRAAALYAAAAWLLVQVATQVFPFFDAPNWAIRGIVVAALIGFPFWLLLAWFYELTPEGLKRESEVTPEASITRSTGRKLDFLIIGVLAVAVVLLLTDRFVLNKDGEDGAAISDKSIAVLPLHNESGDPNDQYFSDGLSEDLITALAQFQGLKVIARDSAFRFRDTGEDSKAIGAKLGVAHLLQGSVRRAGGVVRISANLVKAADGSTLWSQRYDRPYRDLFALQDEITKAVSGALQARLLASDRAAIQSEHPASGNVAAYDAVLQGNFYLDHRTDADTRKAIGYYEQATVQDPAYAFAWARLAIARNTLLVVYSPTPVERPHLVAATRAASATALKLDDTLAEAHSAQGWVLQTLDRDLRSAALSLQRAVRLAPQSSFAVHRLATLQATRGRLDEAVVIERQAITLNPLSSPAHYNLGLDLAALKRYPEAEASFRKAIELQPLGAQNHAFLAIVQLLQGQAAAALASAQEESDPFWRTWALALVQGANGDHAASDAALKQLIAEDADDGGMQIAIVYAYRQQPDKMFEWLDRALAAGDGGVTELYHSPFVDRYQDDPRFAALCRKIGLPTPDELKQSGRSG
jgi:TolB-like protein/Flp pilus assembly protein TadD